MDGKIRIGAVSYLNTKPLLYGLHHAPISHDINLILDYPAHIAEMLMQDRIDIGLVPVAIIPKLQDYYLVSDYCIGSTGAVTSVAIFSEEPLTKLDTILLDYQSRTSAALARLLIKNYWKLDVEIRDTGGEEYRHQISGRTGGLVIGDRALEQRSISPYHADLGEAWKKFTGLDFVFAAWISNKPVDEKFVSGFNQANLLGLNHIADVIRETPYPHYDLNEYYHHSISYNLDLNKRKGMRLFLDMIRETSVVSG